jgi:hypothetical protein
MEKTKKLKSAHYANVIGYEDDILLCEYAVDNKMKRCQTLDVVCNIDSPHPNERLGSTIDKHLRSYLYITY